MTSFELTAADKLVLEALVAQTGAKTKREAIVAGLHQYAAAEGIDIDALTGEARTNA